VERLVLLEQHLLVLAVVVVMVVQVQHGLLKIHHLGMRHYMIQVVVQAVVLVNLVYLVIQVLLVVLELTELLVIMGVLELLVHPALEQVLVVQVEHLHLLGPVCMDNLDKLEVQPFLQPLLFLQRLLFAEFIL
jgi:hypothetical protein